LAIIQISRIQVRRGLKEDLPQLASAEFGWAIDTRQLYIGNGTSEEGAPTLGNTEILTQFSDIFSLSGVYTFKGREAGFTVQTGLSTLAPITRAMQDKFDDFANLRDFGAKGDGLMHDSSGDGTEGDGMLEIEAINRAITELYKSTVVGNNPRARRTIHIPAGTYLIYGDFIRLMPYVKLKGDGKNATFLVQASELQPCLISSCDSKLHTGFPYYFPDSTPIDATDLVDILPGHAEVEDLTLVNVNDKDIAYLHTVTDILFTRVGFVGPDQLLPTSTGSVPLPAACVRMASSQFNNLESSEIMFRDCEFSGKVYGFYADSKITNVKFDGCKFDRLYRGLNLGQANDGGTMPASIKVSHSVFDNIAAEGIYAEAGLYNGVGHIVSAFNTYKNVGQGQTISTVVTPVVSLGGNNCYSIGDLFVRPFDAPVPAVQLFGKASFATLANGRTILGKQFTVGGEEVRLLDNTTIDTVAGVIGFRDYPTIIEYSIIRGINQRVGTLHITPLGATVNYSDDYVETNDIGVTLTPVLNTGVVELTYQATLDYQDAMLKTSSRTLMGATSPPPLPAVVPQPPTNVTAVSLNHPGIPTDVVAI
jgi:hypothetical protein